MKTTFIASCIYKAVHPNHHTRHESQPLFQNLNHAAKNKHVNTIISTVLLRLSHHFLPYYSYLA